MSKDLFVSVILLCGGLGLRMKSPVPKQFIFLRDKPVIQYSFELFCSCPDINEIIVVCENSSDLPFQCQQSLPLKIAKPGARRQDSVFNGFQMISPQSDLVCIHDSARPLLFRSDLNKVILEAAQHGAAALGVPVKSTIKKVDAQGVVITTLDRSSLWEVQTPQVIHPGLLKRGFAIANQKDLTVTDDISLVELLNHPVKVVEGSYQNLKITTPEDLGIAETFLSLQK